MPNPRLTWRKEPRERGLAGVARSARSGYGFDLWRGKERVASVREIGPRWYWYGCGHNTLNRPSGQKRTFATAHEAKLDAVAWVKANPPTPEATR